jgi:hypothetical protein
VVQINDAMPTVLFRCPATALHVQAWIDEDSEISGDYRAVQCIACNRVHVFNFKTGRVVGDDTPVE